MGRNRWRTSLLLLVVLLSFVPRLAGAADRADEPDGKPAHDSGDDPQDSPLFAAVNARGGLSLHKDIFALPATWSDRFSSDETEVVFQVSAKVRLHRTRLFFGYTQRSFWQAYNSDESSPFRETNYNPELFYRMVPGNSSLRHWGFDAGFDHESNGQGGDESRSWNRLFVAPHYYLGERVLLYARLWYRIPEDDCTERSCRNSGEYDNNPDITDFMGYGEVRVGLALTEGKRPQMLQLMLRGNPSRGKGAVSLDYSYPGLSKDLYWFASYFDGYGESLIDYDISTRRIGLGVLLKR